MVRLRQTLTDRTASKRVQGVTPVWPPPPAKRVSGLTRQPVATAAVRPASQPTVAPPETAVLLAASFCEPVLILGKAVTVAGRQAAGVLVPRAGPVGQPSLIVPNRLHNRLNELRQEVYIVVARRVGVGQRDGAGLTPAGLLAGVVVTADVGLAKLVRVAGGAPKAPPPLPFVTPRTPALVV